MTARLTQNRSVKAQWSFYGHLMAYLSCIYGHQGEVFQNLTVDAVVLAKHDLETHVFLVDVSVRLLLREDTVQVSRNKCPL